MSRVSSVQPRFCLQCGQRYLYIFRRIFLVLAKIFLALIAFLPLSIFNIIIWVIPNHFNKSSQVTLSELDETWYVSSTCGFMKPDKISHSYVVWLPG